MARSLLDGIRAAVQRYELLPAVPQTRVLVGCSGGADSVALLHALGMLREELKIDVWAAHVDHGLRGPESDADAAFAVDLARALAVPCRVERVTVPPGNVEAEARRVRYAALERIADAIGAGRIATAHTLEDQAETLLLRFVRGAGRRGLAGILPRRGRVIRPLLLCDRVQVRAHLVEHRLCWRRDRSNFDVGRHRAQIRLGHLPVLARELNPSLVRTLARTAETMREEDRLLDHLAARAIGRDTVLHAAVLVALDPALARRAVRLWWRRSGSGRRLGAEHVETIRALAARGDDAEAHLPGGVVERVGGIVRMRGEHATVDAPAAFELALHVGETIRTPGGWTLALREAAPDEPVSDDTACVLDCGAVSPPLTVRSRRPGDRIRLLGLGGHTTIKRLLIARRVPRELRGALPIVTADDRVLWIPGAGRSAHALVGPATGRALLVEARPPTAQAPTPLP